MSENSSEVALAASTETYVEKFLATDEQLTRVANALERWYLDMRNTVPTILIQCLFHKELEKSMEQKYGNSRQSNELV